MKNNAMDKAFAARKKKISMNEDESKSKGHAEVKSGPENKESPNKNYVSPNQNPFQKGDK